MLLRNFLFQILLLLLLWDVVWWSDFDSLLRSLFQKSTVALIRWMVDLQIQLFPFVCHIKCFSFSEKKFVYFWVFPFGTVCDSFSPITVRWLYLICYIHIWFNSAIKMFIFVNHGYWFTIRYSIDNNIDLYKVTLKTNSI